MQLVEILAALQGMRARIPEKSRARLKNDRGRGLRSLEPDCEQDEAPRTYSWLELCRDHGHVS